ncbi:MAG: hypothetical protein IJW86_02555 [Clostridia bacterium]|nr:hypothetical protein [Clostridia bacterium]
MKKLKETDIAVIGVIVTVILYVMNVLGTGVIVGGDIGRIGRGLPFYGFVAPILFIALAAFVGYYTKKYSMKKAFTAVYVTLILPFAAEAVLIPIASEPISTPWIIAPMYLAMPINSLSTYLFDTVGEVGRLLHLNDDFLAGAIIPASLLLPVVTAPIVYRFTPEKGDD